MCIDTMSKAQLRDTVEQETKSYRHWLTKAEAAESTGDKLMADEYRVCADLSFVQAKEAERMLTEIENREEAEYEQMLEDAAWRKQTGDGVYAK